ncbi:MAG TPA: hypothetical protein VGC65_05090 [Bacteroidia bacterium]|jgi:hypothetical protein
MKTITILFTLSVIFLSFSSTGEKKLSGHWVSEQDLYEMKVNDTLIFIKTTYSDKLYQWGGALCGIELAKNNEFREYSNVLCSTETNPVRYGDEKWSTTKNMIQISSTEREILWSVISATNKKLTVLVLKNNSK